MPNIMAQIYGAGWCDGLMLKDYLDLHCPSSQCISMQWTIRDSKIINLPIPLLVEGDVILLRPGQIIPAKTQPLKSYADDLEIPKEFIKDEHYTPSHGCSNIDELNKVLTCLPLKPEPYIMQETPFLELFRQYLNRSYDKSNYRMDKKWLNIYVLLLRKVFLVLLIIMILINCLRYKFYSNLVSDVYDMVIFLQDMGLIEV
ncbi:hypothetical protein HELRODRAFT_179534 [Helobdella robusta]|uniref:Uncharacterized protein n=1 Tax=Helobdella robusta TaxID=6412 RepID=T1FEU9_HELRO|nr:hypothetical protein HELRODRAFT_179534 [Helobdella robusta]ESN95205.1 hypothetical protein HELRODRAFT_179534 [Helobdella robusta]